MIENKEINRTFEKYPEYKDSGVEWLGEIPESWELISNKYIFNLKKNQVGKKSSDYVLLSLTLRGIIQRVLEDGGKFPAEFDTYQEVKKGDFVFCLFDVEETPRCIGLSDYEGMITGAYTVMDLKPGFSKRFLYYFYLNLDNDKRLRPLYTGLRNTISKDNFFSFKSFVPSFDEQTAIATFLDNKTSKIDTAIAQKEQMIALLKERKQIIIQNAVTGKWSMVNGQWSMTPREKMKDSGVEWIGEIPEHWEVKKLKHLLKIKNGQDYKHVLADEGYPVIGSGGPFSLASDYLYDGEALLLGRKGTIDKPLYVNEKFWTVDTMFYAIVEKTCSTKYMFYLAQTIPFKLYSTSTALPSMTQDDLNNHKVSIPILEEQLIILDYIENQLNKINQAISLQQSQIEKLKEYKATLIDSAVTGKIKVTDE